ncbi:MAG: TraR/DksA C4-type zinc finger protein [Sedimentisphaerales bacterium]|nr:TraR/DksA C4-type zinc finger protein [Sedimentisphaerales bacterium]
MAKKKKTTKKNKTAEEDTTAKSRLKESDLKKFRQLLLEKRTEILGSVNSMKDETLKKERSDLSNVPFHMADAGSDNFEMENTLGLMDEEVKLLKEIDAALVRIEMGNYGICEGSGKPIPKARLDAIPWARYSIQYKELLEKGLVQPIERYDNEYEDESGHKDTDKEEAEEESEDEDIDEEDELDGAFEKLDENMSLIDDGEEDDEEER